MYLPRTFCTSVTVQPAKDLLFPFFVNSPTSTPKKGNLYTDSRKYQNKSYHLKHKILESNPNSVIHPYKAVESLSVS